MFLLLCTLLWLQATPARPLVAPQPHPQEGAARETLKQYAAALEFLDADQVKKVHPAVDVDALRRAFRDMRSLKVTIDDIRVLSSDGAILRVSCKVTQTLTPKIGKQHVSPEVLRVFRLRKQEAVWVIDGFER